MYKYKNKLTVKKGMNMNKDNSIIANDNTDNGV